MTRDEAKEILLLYRRGTADDAAPGVVAALELARRDEELRHWFEEHDAFQSAMREKFRAIEPPAGLKDRLLEARSITRVKRWRQPTLLALAAIGIILLGLAAFWLPGDWKKDDFEAYRSRMVRAALREYSMDILTNDLTVIRQHLDAHKSPAGYILPERLAELRAIGAGSLTWRGNPVSMVCFDRGGSNMLFLFVIDRRAVKNPPTSVGTEFAGVNKLMTLNWSDATNAYVLAGAGPSAALKPFAPRN